MSMQVNRVNYDDNVRLNAARMQQLRRVRTDGPVQQVQPVSLTETAVEPAARVSGSSALTADKIQLSAHAQQLLAQQEGSSSLSYGTALASSDFAAIAAQPAVRSPIQSVQQEIPQDVTAVYPVSAAPPAADGTAASSGKIANSKSTSTFQQHLENAAKKENAVSQDTLSTGVQRYLQVQNCMIPQMQTAAVAMNLLA
ncbi:MAG TPA: hypothetical protein DEP27_02525 [Ruminococcaceae bacterium]|nr:hypothetical protein [Oscillospiraceae bacterium]